MPAKLAGYPQGSQFAASARKRARRQDVKVMVAELQKPAKEKLQQQITANLEWATRELFKVGNQPLGIWHRRDKVRAIEVLAKMHGWNAPEKPNFSRELKIRRIEWVIVEPKNRDGGGVPPPAGEGEI